MGDDTRRAAVCHKISSALVRSVDTVRNSVARPWTSGVGMHLRQREHLIMQSGGDSSVTLVRRSMQGCVIKSKR